MWGGNYIFLYPSKFSAGGPITEDRLKKAIIQKHKHTNTNNNKKRAYISQVIQI